MDFGGVGAAPVCIFAGFENKQGSSLIGGVAGCTCFFSERLANNSACADPGFTMSQCGFFLSHSFRLVVVGETLRLKIFPVVFS